MLLKGTSSSMGMPLCSNHPLARMTGPQPDTIKVHAAPDQVLPHHFIIYPLCIWIAEECAPNPLGMPCFQHQSPIQTLGWLTPIDPQCLARTPGHLLWRLLLCGLCCPFSHYLDCHHFSSSSPSSLSWHPQCLITAMVPLWLKDCAIFLNDHCILHSPMTVFHPLSPSVNAIGHTLVLPPLLHLSTIFFTVKMHTRTFLLLHSAKNTTMIMLMLHVSQLVTPSWSETAALSLVWLYATLFLLFLTPFPLLYISFSHRPLHINWIPDDHLYVFLPFCFYWHVAHFALFIVYFFTYVF